MLIPTEKKPTDEAYTEIATAAKDQKYGVQLAALQTAYNSLSGQDERWKSRLSIGSSTAYYMSPGIYSRFYLNSARTAVVVSVYDILNAKAFNASISNGANPTFLEITDNDDGSAMKLYKCTQP